jgi:hypothetical protein
VFLFFEPCSAQWISSAASRRTVLGTRLRPFHIADDGLPTIVHMDVLDADKLLTAGTQAS